MARCFMQMDRQTGTFSTSMLCQITGETNSETTNKDYNENGLSELLALYGSAYNANIKIFK